MQQGTLTLALSRKRARGMIVTYKWMTSALPYAKLYSFHYATIKDIAMSQQDTPKEVKPLKDAKESSKSSPEKLSTEKSSTKSASRKSSHLFVAILAIIAITICGYLWWQLDSVRRDIRFKHQHTQDHIEATTKSSQTLQAQVQNLQQTTATLTQQQRLLEQNTSAPQPSPLAYLQPMVTVDYLLRMADIEINALGNITTGATLLDIVRTQLPVLPQATATQLESGLDTIHQQLATLGPQTDTIISQLRVLQQNIAALPTQSAAPEYQISAESETTPLVSDEKPLWHKALSASGRFISQFFRFQRYDADAQFQAPLPITEQQSQHELLTLFVQQAILAALQHDADNYHQALQSTDELLAQLHPTADIAKIREMLAALQSVSPQLPHIDILSLGAQLNANRVAP